MAKGIGRKKPYTSVGIARVKCAHCGRPASYQWNACAIGNRWVPLCASCDIKVNEWFLKFSNTPNREKIMGDYRKRVTEETKNGSGN